MLSTYFFKQRTCCLKLAAILFFLAVAPACKKSATPNQPAPPVLSPNKELKTFFFKADRNPALSDDVDGIIKGDTIFVPAFAGADLSKLVPEFTFEGEKVIYNDVEQEPAENVRNFMQPLTYYVVAKDHSKKAYVIKFIDNGVPAIYINTNSGLSITSKDIYQDATIKTVSNFTESSSVLVTQIKGHGNSTWNDLPKKPYRLKLDKKVSLLGMPAGKNWILLANYADKSLMRNELAFNLSRSIGRTFTPASRYAELYLNGQFLGNYQLTQQVKEGPGLVDIEDQDGATALPDISGGYLVEQDLFGTSQPVYFQTGKKMTFVLKYPDDDKINQQQKDYIKAHFQKAEDAMFAANFADPVNGYRKYFDVNTYVDYYIVNEVIGNPDMFRSNYLFKKRNDDKIYTGPIWDFDKAANNDNRLGDQVNGLMYTAAFEPKMWIKQLMLDQTFRQKIRTRWNELKPKIMALPNVTDVIAKQLTYSQKANFIKWDILKRQSYLEVNVAGSYPGEVQYLRNFLVNHIAWLDTKFNGPDYQ